MIMEYLTAEQKSLSMYFDPCCRWLHIHGFNIHAGLLAEMRIKRLPMSYM